MINAEELRRLQELFRNNNWNPSETLTYPKGTLFDVLSSFVAGVEKKDREIVFSLLQKYEVISDYRVYLSGLVDKFRSIYQVGEQYYFVPVLPPDSGKVKSGHFFLYQLVPPIKHEGFDKVLDLDSPWSSKIINVQNAVVVFVDDFVGTGDQFLDETYKPFLIRKGKPKRTILMAIRILQEGYDRVSAENIDVLADEIRPKAISSGYATGNMQIADAKSSYSNIEAVIDIPNGYNFGYGQAEAIITMMKTPDNTLPIFWASQRKGGNSWPAPFPRPA